MFTSYSVAGFAGFPLEDTFIVIKNIKGFKILELQVAEVTVYGILL